MDTGDEFIPLACSDGALLQVIFFKPLAYLLLVHSAKKPRAWRNVMLEIPTKWDFSGLLCLIDSVQSMEQRRALKFCCISLLEKKGS